MYFFPGSWTHPEFPTFIFLGGAGQNLLGCPWKLVTIVSKLVYNLLKGLITYRYIGVITQLLYKYHGHPSRKLILIHDD